MCFRSFYREMLRFSLSYWRFGLLHCWWGGRELIGSWCWVQIVKKVCFHVIIKEIWSERLKCCKNKKEKKLWIRHISINWLERGNTREFIWEWDSYGNIQDIDVGCEHFSRSVMWVKCSLPGLVYKRCSHLPLKLHQPFLIPYFKTLLCVC